MELGKIPPHDIDAEQAVLGSMLTDKDAVNAAIETLKEALETLEESPQDASDDEMIEIVTSLIEKLQLIEDKYFHALDFEYYLRATEEDDYAD